MRHVRAGKKCQFFKNELLKYTRSTECVGFQKSKKVLNHSTLAPPNPPEGERGGTVLTSENVYERSPIERSMGLNNPLGLSPHQLGLVGGGGLWGVGGGGGGGDTSAI